MLKSFYQHKLTECGCDEAGRGCLAGPVVAAAVILRKDFHHPLLNDSKQISEKKRELLFPIIKQEAIAWGIGIVSPIEIDEINILNASFLAMHRAIDQLKTTPELLLIDGNRFNSYKNISHKCIIKGDAKFSSIAAASVLAKTHRDFLMTQLDTELPNYYWKKNKGYPTKQHRQAIRDFGTTEYHRKRCRLLPEQVEVEFDSED